MLCWIAVIQILYFLPICYCNYIVEIKGHLARMHSNYIIGNISNSNIHHCLHNCMVNCSCLSFQICGTVCQLLSTTITEGSLKEDGISQCNHFTMHISDIEKNQSCCKETCQTIIDCCRTSSHCNNRGKCELSKPSSRRRASCNCDDGYVGDRCQTMARSCRSYRGQQNGQYKIFTPDEQLISVYCHFDGHRAWTLVQSFSLENSINYENKPYYKNFPRNVTSPSWKDYRLSLETMIGIKEDKNDRWRITCNYTSINWNVGDRLEATYKNIELLDEKKYDGECVLVEYVNIRGASCSRCNISIFQNENYIFHADSTKTKCGRTWNGTPCDGLNEDNFGHYKCRNNRHDCTSSNNATTQLWFGNE
ncbi:uncharacterized protein LOC124457719 [Xenia sp. Carnegie-2017]|uniref:uncharacterized protein LOC124457719 n=1 Tax=Xenia sp. Carnegie-2017 TaxID=2897299 RepID=UPI001F04CF5D|nr:uncharacterized protein LOC124457719 [Xenia sp. Carnegie-2017]